MSVIAKPALVYVASIGGSNFLSVSSSSPQGSNLVPTYNLDMYGGECSKLEAGCYVDHIHLVLMDSLVGL